MGDKFYAAFHVSGSKFGGAYGTGGMRKSAINKQISKLTQ